MLKLRDLTRSDVEEYVSASLDELLWSMAVLARLGVCSVGTDGKRGGSSLLWV